MYFGKPVNLSFRQEQKTFTGFHPIRIMYKANPYR